MQTYKLVVMTPETTLFEGEVVAAIFPGIEGSFETLAHHTPLIAMVKAGTIVVVDKNKKKQRIPIEEGFFQFQNNSAVLLTTPPQETIA